MYAKRAAGGFTLVELLIVIVVIAILASISIVSYNGVQERARKAQFASDISNIKKSMEMFKAATGLYPRCPSGAECMYLTSIRPQLVPDYASSLSNYNYNYVVQTVGSDERWALRYLANADPYKLPTTCKFGVNMASTWYSSAPEC